MKSMKKYFIAGLILSFHISVFGQFNTLIPIVQKKAEIPKIVEQIKEADIPKPKKEKKSWKKVFNITTKSYLKNEIDSLKSMIKEISVSNSRKGNLKKSWDSLVFSIKSKVIKDFQNELKVPNKDLDGNIFFKIVMPLNRKISIISTYGARIHPIFGTSKFHNGIDLAAHFENVYSVLDGTVTEKGWDDKGGGNYIKIRHFNRYETTYLHLSEIYYRVGEFVKAGFVIAKSGNSGNSTGPHLHFSVNKFGQSINPTHFLNDLIKANQLITTYYAK